MNSNTETFTVDLSNCDKEPIHILGKVQSHSVLLALREPEFIIEQISENCEEHFGIPVDDLLGQPVEIIMGGEYFKSVHSIFSQDLEANPNYIPRIRIGKRGKRFEGLAHRYKGILILEFEEPSDEEIYFNVQSYSAVKNSLSLLDKTRTVKDFCQVAAEQIRQFTEFDRVMVYKFLEDNSGHIIAEAVREDLESYLNLHYPASDIPEQARELYLKQWLRLIVDVNAEQSPIVPQINPATNEPLDLSYAVTRSMSPVHVEYLKNIGAAASMSISIIRDGKLWGLIACHHCSPKYIPHEVRMACEFLAHILSLQMNTKEKAEDQKYINQLDHRQNQLIEQMSQEEFYYDGLISDEPDLLTDFDADGAALVLDGKVYLQGKTPNETRVGELSQWLWEKIDEDIYSTDNLSDKFVEAADYTEIASGILAVRLTKYKPEYLLWFRQEYRHHIKWAGNPKKAVTVGKFGERLTPRQSFAEWKETVKGKSKPWKQSELDYALGLRRAIVEIIVKKSEELVKLKAKLKQNNSDSDLFVHTASHDLKAPLREIQNFSHFLLEDCGNKIEEKGIEQIKTLISLSERMELLLDTLLEYSHIGRADISHREIDLNEYIQESFLAKEESDGKED